MGERSCLVVEDSPTMRRLIVFALSRIPNLRTVEAADGLAALRELASNHFDLIVTDINMPIMDGLKLIKRIRSDAAHNTTRIIVITTEGAREVERRAIALGADAFINKPIQSRHVISAAEVLLPPPTSSITNV